MTHPISGVAAGVFLLGLAVLVLGRTRYLTRWRRMQQGKGMMSAWAVVTVAVATVMIGVTALVVVLGRALG